MKKTIFFLSIIWACLNIIGCSDTLEYSNIPEYKNANNNGSEYTAALNKVKSFGSSNNLKMASMDEMKILSVETKNYPIKINELSKKQTKSGVSNVDTTSINLFTITFEKKGNKGFAISTGDERLSNVFAYTENGQLSDTIYNIGLAYTLSQIPEICKEYIQTYYNKSGQLSINATTSQYINYGPWIATKWDQENPYNNQCPSGNGCTHSLAGCAAIAISQALIYISPFTRPSDFPQDIDFSQLRTNTYPINCEEMAAELVYYIGRKCNMQYGCDESGCTMDNVVNTCQLIGLASNYNDGNIDYTKLTTCIAYQSNSQILQQQGGGLCISSGIKKKGNKAGHVWLICGVRGNVYVDPNGNSLNKYQPVNVSTMTYYCNWGWGGRSDGWYVASDVEYPTGNDYPYIKDNKQLYISKL